jgi:hypothetical protein
LEWKTGFIEDYMLRDKDSAYGLLQASISSMVGAVAKKNTEI